MNDKQNEALQELYNSLQNGAQYGKYITLRFAVFSYALYLDWKKEYIFWNHFGSSAMKNTPDSLVWILEHIFRMTPEEFVRNYQIYDEDALKTWEAIAEKQNTNEYRIWDGTVW